MNIFINCTLSVLIAAAVTGCAVSTYDTGYYDGYYGYDNGDYGPNYGYSSLSVGVMGVGGGSNYNNSI